VLPPLLCLLLGAVCTLVAYAKTSQQALVCCFFCLHEHSNGSTVQTWLPIVFAMRSRADMVTTGGLAFVLLSKWLGMCGDTAHRGGPCDLFSVCKLTRIVMCNVSCNNYMLVFIGHAACCVTLPTSCSTRPARTCSSGNLSWLTFVLDCFVNLCHAHHRGRR
jgi:hypothetical protein